MPRRKKTESEGEEIKADLTNEADIELKEIKKTWGYISKQISSHINKFIKDALLLGQDLKTKYDLIARALGFEDVYDFIENAVNFYLEYKDKIEELEKTIMNLKFENMILRILTSDEAKRILKAKILEKLMITAIMTNANPELLLASKKLIDEVLGENYGNRLEFPIEQFIEVIKSAEREFRESFGSSEREEGNTDHAEKGEEEGGGENDE